MLVIYRIFILRIDFEHFSLKFMKIFTQSKFNYFILKLCMEAMKYVIRKPALQQIIE